jgi:hypothetical protein
MGPLSLLVFGLNTKKPSKWQIGSIFYSVDYPLIKYPYININFDYSKKKMLEY